MPNEPSAHGWKTYLAAIIGILSGALAIANGSYVEGMALIAAGLAVFGIGHKLAKLIQSNQ